MERNDEDLNQSGNRLAIASPTSIEFNTSAGAFVLYEFSNGNWTQVGNIVTGLNANDNLGTAIAINSSGDKIAIGSPRIASFGTDSGEITLYELNSNTWQEIASVPGQLSSSLTGTDVDINAAGNIISTGANGILPQVRVFEIETLGINSFDIATVKIFPNPSVDILTVETLNEGSFEIFSIDGRKIRESEKLQTGQNTINVQNLDNGTYILKITNNSGVYSHKIIVSK